MERAALIIDAGRRMWTRPLYDCGACGYGTCAEFLQDATTHHGEGSDDWEFVGPVCQIRCIDLGIAVGSAAKLAGMNNIDTRCQTRVAAAAPPPGIIEAAGAGRAAHGRGCT